MGCVTIYLTDQRKNITIIANIFPALRTWDDHVSDNKQQRTKNRHGIPGTYARSAGDTGRCRTLRGAARYAAECLSDIGLPQPAYLSGLLHDPGKATEQFWGVYT